MTANWLSPLDTTTYVCNDELGVKDGGRIPSSRLSASGVFQNNVITFGPQRARLNIPFRDQADHWSPRVNDKTQWLQVHLVSSSFRTAQLITSLMVILN